MLSHQSEGIRIDGHLGTWYVIDMKRHNGEWVFLLEHEQYGEDAAAIIVDKDGKVIMEDVHNGLRELG